jgi:hypothetical protein
MGNQALLVGVALAMGFSIVLLAVGGLVLVALSNSWRAAAQSSPQSSIDPAVKRFESGVRNEEGQANSAPATNGPKTDAANSGDAEPANTPKPYHAAKTGPPQVALVCVEGDDPENGRSYLPIAAAFPVGERAYLTRAWWLASFDETQLENVRRILKLVSPENAAAVVRVRFHPNFPRDAVREKRIGDAEMEVLSRSDFAILEIAGEPVAPFFFEESPPAVDRPRSVTIAGFDLASERRPVEQQCPQPRSLQVKMLSADAGGRSVPVVAGSLPPMMDGGPVLDAGGRVVALLVRDGNPQERESGEFHPVQLMRDAAPLLAPYRNAKPAAAAPDAEKKP